MQIDKPQADHRILGVVDADPCGLRVPTCAMSATGSAGASRTASSANARSAGRAGTGSRVTTVV
jgi:hypothetical protein